MYIYTGSLWAQGFRLHQTPTNQRADNDDLVVVAELTAEQNMVLYAATAWGHGWDRNALSLFQNELLAAKITNVMVGY
jgi:hypothetical protein